MKVSGRCRLEAFCRQHADARRWIEHWLSELDGMSWKSAADLQAKYHSVTVGPGNRALFLVLDGKYCLEVTVAYGSGTVCVRWAGTRHDYGQRSNRLPHVIGM